MSITTNKEQTIDQESLRDQKGQVASATQPDNPTQEQGKKKGKTVLFVILGIIVALILAAVIWFFAFYNRPEKIAADAVTNLVTSSSLQFTGEKTSQTNTVKTDAVTHYDNENFSASIKDTITPSGTNVNFNVETVIAPTGRVYIRVSGLGDIAKQTQSTLLKTALGSTVNAITALENDWWEIDLNETTPDIQLDEKVQNALSELSECIFKSLTANNFKTLSQLYQQNAFLTAEKDQSRDAYLMHINTTKLTNFINSLLHSKITSNIATCVNKASRLEVLDASMIKDVSEYDVAKVVNQWPNIYAKIGIFDHRITEISTEDSSTKSSYKVSYPDSVVIKTPESYKPISEAGDQVVQLLTQLTTQTTGSKNKE